MSGDPRLERYLSTLESTLKPFSVSDRAEIITEIKSHVLSALERDPNSQLDVVLQALGEPETVANRYLLERGLKPTKPPISPIVKWMVIGFLATMAMVLLFLGFVIAQFSPIVKVDEGKDHVSLMGGLIEVDGDKGNVSFSNGTYSMFNGNRHTFNGATDVPSGDKITIRLGTGKAEFTTSPGHEFTWKCQSRSSTPPKTETAPGKVSVDTTEMSGAKCEFSLPTKTQLALKADTGKLEFNQPRFAIEATLGTGKIAFEPATDMHYRVETSVGTGHADTFETSTLPEAIAIRFNVGTGKISLEN